jgi:hypothetical protein
MFVYLLTKLKRIPQEFLIKITQHIVEISKKYSLWLICCRFIVIFGECIVVYIAVRHHHKSQTLQQSYAADICHCCGWCYRNFQNVVIYRMLL